MLYLRIVKRYLKDTRESTRVLTIKNTQKDYGKDFV